MPWCIDRSEFSSRSLTECMLRFLWFTAASIVGLSLFCQSAEAVEFRTVRWGFNGTTKRHEFNLCSIELINPSPQAFQGTVQLQPTSSSYSDIPLVEPDIYIGPNESRIIQFLPFISSDDPRWEVRWGQGIGERAEVPAPTRSITSTVTVQFVNADAISSAIKGIELFDDADFPIGVPGTEVLGTVILDHVPRWDELRRRAFRDWLGQGGQLYLLDDRNGMRLEFPSPLEELNIAADQFAVGQGRVIRHALVQDIGEIAGLVPLVAASAASSGDSPAVYQDNSYNDPRANGIGQLFQNLQSRVRPNHNWPLIFFLAVIYLLVLFPGIWIFSRKKGDFRVTYAAILGTVAIFSLLYAEIGKRGYDESTGLYEMIIAEPLGNQRLLTRSYANLFVTDGGEYQVPPRGEAAVMTLESGGNDAARFSGSASILGRPKAAVLADIPPFSSCSFQSHSVISTTADYSMSVDKFEVANENLNVVARLGSGIPAAAKVYVITDTNTVAELAQADGTWSCSSAPQQISAMFPVENQYRWSHPSPAEIDKNLRAALLQIATRTLVLREMYYVSPETPTAKVTPTRGFLVAIAPAPEEIRSDQYSSNGQVLFMSRISPDLKTSPTP